jgi:hypothetical protein
MILFIFNEKKQNKPCPIRTRPAMMIVKIVETLQMTRTILVRLAIDTLNELILMRITGKKTTI